MDKLARNSVSALAGISKVNGFEFRPMNSKHEIREAQRLLYRCYKTESNWKIPHSNPSNINIYRSNSDHELTDDHSYEAAWFGAYNEKTLIGCFRVLVNLELPKYIDLPSELQILSTELNRLAIESKYRKHRIITLMLLRTAFDYAFSVGLVVYVTAENPEPSGMFQRMGLIRYDFEPFKYHNTDPSPVDILFYDTRKYNRYSTSLYKLTSRFMCLER